MWLLLILLNIQPSAQALDVFKIHEAYFEYRGLKAHSRNPIVPSGETITSSYGIYTDIALIWRLHFKSLVHTTATNVQFRTVGWQFWLGLRPWDWIELGMYHHSQHTLDTQIGRYPLEDGLYLKVWFNRF